MRIKNAFKILISNSVVIYKAMFYKLITSSLIALLAYFVVAKDIRYIFGQPEVNAFWNSIITTFSEFFKGNPLNKDLIPEAFDAILVMLKDNLATITLASMKIGIFLLLLNVVERMGNYAIGILTNGYMSSLSKYSLVASLLANIGKSFLYSIIIVPLAFVFDGLILLIAVLIGVYGIRVISVFAIILALMFVVIALSCKFTIISRFMPTMITEKKSATEAFKTCFTKREKFLHMVGNYAFVIMISFYLNVSVAVFTLGAGLIVALPLTSIFTIIVSFVDTYQLSGKKYYVSGEEVVTPRQMREHADLLKYM